MSINKKLKYTIENCKANIVSNHEMLFFELKVVLCFASYDRRRVQ